LPSPASFARTAEKSRPQQDLLAGVAQYSESLLTLLDKLSSGAQATALEVGPGHGGFLPELARRFRQVIAMHNSPVMLD
ncbi:ArsR family transcriptional regulator, partial [Pseudomonas syringae pv. tagetis]